MPHNSNISPDPSSPIRLGPRYTREASKHLSPLRHLRCVYKAAVLFVVLAALTSCFHQKPLSRDELKSKLQMAASIGAETTTFIDYAAERRATSRYAKGHVEYLLSELMDTVRELCEARAPAGAETQVADGCKELKALAAALGQLRRDVDRPDELAREQHQIADLRRGIQQTISSL
jgi:hypothetical protein